MRRTARFVLLAAAFALGTWVLGWWAILAVGVLWGWVARRTSAPARTAMGAAVLGWAALLGWTAVQGPVWVVAQRVGPILFLPGWLFVVLTLIFPGILAVLATEVGSGIGARERSEVRRET